MCQCAERADGRAAYAFPAVVFGECVYDAPRAAGFLFGWVSTCLWIVSLYPQVRLTCLLRRAESISIWFFVLWAVGDAFNLASLLLLSKLLTQIVVGVVWLFMDVLALGQQGYFKTRGRRGARGSRVSEAAEASPAPVPPLQRKAGYSALEIAIYVSLALLVLTGMISYSVPAMELYRHDLVPPCKEKTPLDPTAPKYIVGMVLSYLPIPLNMVTRILQLVRTVRRKDSADVSIGFFLILILANFTQFLSIIVDDEDLLGQTPFIVSALLPMGFDIAILCLMRRQRRRQAKGGLLDQEDRRDDASRSSV
ncbi:Seven transmembrane protein 1 [Giardia muris]|uniref:Seven transmembrane protein 1 n=1 Tax=Giardia muris TaxID=5742 RepID=A0A4Z1SYY1_GIAMU|nr:Seven transmembrane protein 1 [Giardia muris]|eukprot:TNJ26873.1 Seven transmembrane protein 1 [Giardia muris]